MNRIAVYCDALYVCICRYVYMYILHFILIQISHSMQVDLLCAFRRVSQRVSRRLAHSQAHSINVGNIHERGKVFMRLQYPFCFVMPCHATLSSAMLEQWRCLTDTCARFRPP